MKKRGLITGLLFLVLLAFVFQTEITGFFASIRDRAYEAAEADSEAIEALPALSESETAATGEAPPLPGETEEATAEALPGATDSGEVAYREVSLYFVNGSQELAAEKRSIINEGGVAKTTLQELLTGPEESTLSSYIPDGTQVLGVNLKEDGNCVVNFSKEIQSAKLDSTEERLVIESVVETLCQFPSIKSVSFQVEGKAIESLTGHWDVSAPIAKEDLKQ